MEKKSFDASKYSPEQLTALIEQALSIAGTRGIEALSDAQRDLLDELARVVDNTAMMLGSTPEQLLSQAGKNPDGFLAQVKQAKQALTSRTGLKS